MSTVTTRVDSVVATLVSEYEDIFDSLTLSQFCCVLPNYLGSKKIIIKKNDYNIQLELTNKYENQKHIITLKFLKFVHLSQIEIITRCSYRLNNINYLGISKKWNENELNSISKEKRLEEKCNSIVTSQYLAEIELTVQVIQKDNDISKLSDDLHSLLKSGDNSDFVFKFGEKSIKAHKFILKNRNQVFNKMIKSDMLENKSNSVDIEDIDIDVFEKLLYFIYTAKEPVIDDEKIHDILIAADRYDVEDLKSICELKIAKKLSVNNAAKNLIFAEQLNCENLKHAIMDFMLNGDIENSVFKNIKDSHPHLIQKLLQKVQLKRSIKQK